MNEYLKPDHKQKIYMPIQKYSQNVQIKLDFSARGEIFNRNWENEIFIPILSHNINAFSVLETVKKEIGFETIILKDFFFEFEELSIQKRSHQYDYLINKINLLLSHAAKIEILLDADEDESSQAMERANLFWKEYSKIYTLDLNRISYKSMSMQRLNKCKINTLDATSVFPALFSHKQVTQPIWKYRQLFDFDDDRQSFQKGEGMLTITGLKKPIYYSWYLLKLLGDELIQEGDGYIITRKHNDFSILLYHTGEVSTPMNIDIELLNIMGNYTITKWHIETEDNAKKYWEQTGKPVTITSYERDFINGITLPATDIDNIKKNLYNIECKPFCVELLKFTEQGSLSTVR